jgi:PilZ domain
MISSASERRREPRHPVQQIGSIFAHPGGQPRYCLIVDRSDNGVRLRTTSDFTAPDQFVLRFAALEGRYRVVLRKGSILGARRIHKLAVALGMR